MRGTQQVQYQQNEMRQNEIQNQDNKVRPEKATLQPVASQSGGQQIPQIQSVPTRVQSGNSQSQPQQSASRQTDSAQLQLEQSVKSQATLRNYSQLQGTGPAARLPSTNIG